MPYQTDTSSFAIPLRETAAEYEIVASRPSGLGFLLSASISSPQYKCIIAEAMTLNYISKTQKMQTLIFQMAIRGTNPAFIMHYIKMEQKKKKKTIAFFVGLW